MKKAGLLLLVMLSLSGLNLLQANSTKAFNSVVKIFAVRSDPSFFQPWQNYQQESSSGSGFVIDNNKIITNAHNVANQTFLQVRKQGDQKKYIAKLVSVGHECDLAILKVDDPEFYRNMPPLELGDLPDLRDKVNVLGYPVGGDNISITEGVVSRIEPIRYSHTGRELLAIQIDAAINPGNSGGPVIKDGKVVGVAFQGLSEAQNIGFMIPLPVVRHFLKDVEDGRYDGFPEFDLYVMQMENADIRTWAKMRPGDTGVLVTYLPPLETEKNLLRLNDVILEIDGVKIANDGTVPFRKDEVVFFETMIWQKYIGEKCKMKLLRNGEYLTLDYPVSAALPLAPKLTFDRMPTYFMTGGMLFVPLTMNYLRSWRDWSINAPRRLSYLANYDDISKDRDQVVVLSEILADEVNQGYNVRYQAVVALNGQKIRNLEDMIARIEQQKEGFLELELQDHVKIVLDINKCRAATARIMKRYRIPADRSQNLRPRASVPVAEK